MRRVVAILWLCGTATAQPAPTLAEKAFADGRELLDAGKFAEACAKFEESLKEDPNAPGTLLNLGLCNERLGKTATALQWFRKAQFRSAETGMTDYEDTAKTNTFMLAVRVPTIRITFANPRPSGSTVFFDNQPLTDIDLARLEIDPNTPHVVELRMTGKPPIRTDVVLKDGDNKDVVVPVPPPPTPPPPVIVEVDRGKTRRWLAYGLAGAGAIMWGTSLGVSLYAKSEADASEHPEDWVHYQQVARWGGTSLFVGGALAIAGASYLYFTAPGVEKRTVVSPVVARDEIGVTVHGAF